jgi:hypothetical protein
MFDIVLNPAGMESTYIRCLNTCFGHWGDHVLYQWCFERRIGDFKADLMMFKQGDTILAGSAVTYRKVMLGRTMVHVGVMTGSWTLPEARGRGCFTRIIEESVSLAAAKKAALLLAYVTESNASFRRLAGAGSALFPTHYLFSNAGTPVPESACAVEPVTEVREGVETIIVRLKERQAGFSHFTYTIPEWESQFLARPGDTEFLRIGSLGLAVVERKQNSDRIRMLSLTKESAFADCMKALLKRAGESRRDVFMFTTSSAWRDECLKLKMAHSPGFLTALAADEAALLKAFPGETALPDNLANEIYNPGGPWSIPPWDIQSGDRM